MIPYKAQAASAVVNQYLMSRTADTSTSGKVGLLNVAAESGGSVVNLQRTVNSIASVLGITTAEVYDFLFTWASNDVGSATDTILQRIEALVSRFSVTGHTHDGTAGEAPKILSSNLDDFNNSFASYQATTFNGASGLSTDVSTAFTGKTAGGSTAAYGVVTIAPNNKVDLIHADDGTWIENGNKRVYGYLTESAGVWTVTYYYRDGTNTEQPYNLPLHNLVIIFREVFSAETRPTFDSAFLSDAITMDVTADVADASPTERGLVNTVAQAFAGDKTFQGIIADAVFKLTSATDSTTSGPNAMISPVGSPVIRLTNGSLASVDLIDDTTANKFLVIINATGVDITINDDTGITSSKRILTGTGAGMLLKADASIWLAYDSTSSRWRVIGGSGGGSSVIMDTTANINAMTRVAGQIYFSTDELLFLGDDGTDVNYFLQTQTLGNEGEVLTMEAGAPAWKPSSAGMKNYFPKGNADLGSYGSVYADGASEPIDGTGGTPTASVALSSASPFTGTNSFRYTSGALGDGYSADSNILERKDFGKVFKLEVNFRLVSGTYSDGDLKLFVLDTANSNAPLMITPSNVLPIPSGHDRFEAFVQLPVQTTPSALRFCLHQTTTASFVMDFEFSLVEQAMAGFGQEVNAWAGHFDISGNPQWISVNTAAFADMSLSSGTATLIERLNKNFAQVTAAAGNLPAITFNAKAGSTYHITASLVGYGNLYSYNKFRLTDGTDTIATGADILSAGATNGPTQIVLSGHYTPATSGPVTLRVQGFCQSGFSTYIGDAGYSPQGVRPLEFAIAEYPPATKVISEYDGRSVYFEGYPNSASALTANVSDLPMAPNKDSHSGWNGTQYEVKVAGDYTLTQVFAVGSGGGLILAYVNGVRKTHIGPCTVGAWRSGAGTLHDLKVGDLVSFRFDGATTPNADPDCRISLTLNSGAQKILQGQRGFINGYLPTSTALTAFVTKIPFTVIEDTLQEWSTDTFTAKAAGDRLVTFFGVLSGGAAIYALTSSGKYYFLGIDSNGYVAGAQTIPLAANESFSIYSDSSRTITGGANTGTNGQAQISIKAVN